MRGKVSGYSIGYVISERNFVKMDFSVKYIVYKNGVKIYNICIKVS